MGWFDGSVHEEDGETAGQKGCLLFCIVFAAGVIFWLIYYLIYKAE